MQTKTSLKIDWATHEAAKYACENWHYSKCLPSSLQKRFSVGAWEDNLFVGVVVFGHGANPQIGSPYGLTIYDVCELTRVALKKGHKTNVSKIVSIALKFLKKSNKKLRLVVSYADTGQGHHGGIYQAGNWIYEGISKGVPSLQFNGKKWHAKALRTSFPKLSHSDPRVKKLPATDKHKYLMPLDDDMKKRILPLSKPYPKRASSKDNVASGFQPEEGGAIPTDALHTEGE
jgi:hypothetical protein